MAKNNTRNNLKQRKNRRAKLRTQSGQSNRLPFEQLEARILLASDFGDAPLPYPVTLAEDGARHTIGVLRLGSATVDMETDGTHSSQANFDDLNGSTPDDEDGVMFGTIQVGALQQTLTVNVQGAAGKLNAWIDFNGDGNWGGAGEHIFVSRDVVVGDNNLTFDVPSTAIDGITFARFRLSTAGNLGVTGLAADGEVEDYAVTIAPPTAASGVFAAQTSISPASDSPRSVFAADVDGDGDLDVLSASYHNDKIAWYENDGSQNFTAHTISTWTYANGPRSVFAADVDGDGDLDVLSASRLDSKIAWYENDGNQNFTAHTISTRVDSGAWSVFAADVDGDGDLDVLSASYRVDKIAWYENDGSQNFTAHNVNTPDPDNDRNNTINGNADGARSVFAADVDGDGDLDVLSASENDDKIAWYENDGSQNFTAHNVNTPDPDNDHTNNTNGNADRAWSVFAADVDGDGDLDMLSASLGDDKIAWYENDGSQNFTAHTISTAANGASSVFAADVDGDGDLDVFSASQFDDKIAWYENDGSQNFTAHTISITGSNAHSVFAADVDGDGDLDVLSASAGGNRIAWYAQNQAPVFTSPATANIVENTQAVHSLTASDGDLPAQSITFMIDGSTADNDKFEVIGGNQLQFIVAPDFENPTDVGGAAGDNVYVVSVLAGDGNGGVTPQTILVTVDPANDEVVAKVVGTVINAGSPNRSGLGTIAITFDNVVNFASPTALRLYNHATSQLIDLSSATFTGNGSNLVIWDLAAITFPDGLYTAELVNSDNTILAVSHSRELFVLLGDVDGDGSVNFNDYFAVSANFNVPGAPYTPGDADGDGSVNFNDYLAVSAGFNGNLGAALDYDFGDAGPDSATFPTLLSPNNGARHVLTGNTTLLGTLRDAETDGQPTANATGDGADEDGVVVGNLTIGSSVSVSVTASVPSTAFLNAWVDFNQDGDWDDAGEQVFTDQVLSNGVNSLFINVPGDATVGASTARFRITESAGYSYFGLAPNGEVEDYQLNVVASSEIALSGDSFDGGTYPVMGSMNYTDVLLSPSLTVVPAKQLPVTQPAMSSMFELADDEPKRLERRHPLNTAALAELVGSADDDFVAGELIETPRKSNRVGVPAKSVTEVLAIDEAFATDDFDDEWMHPEKTHRATGLRR